MNFIHFNMRMKSMENEFKILGWGKLPSREKEIVSKEPRDQDLCKICNEPLSLHSTDDLIKCMLSL